MRLSMIAEGSLRELELREREGRRDCFTEAILVLKEYSELSFDGGSVLNCADETRRDLVDDKRTLSIDGKLSQ